MGSGPFRDQPLSRNGKQNCCEDLPVCLLHDFSESWLSGSQNARLPPNCSLGHMLVLVHLVPWSSRLVALAASAPMDSSVQLAARVTECGLWQTILLQNIQYI